MKYLVDDTKWTIRCDAPIYWDILKDKLHCQDITEEQALVKDSIANFWYDAPTMTIKGNSERDFHKLLDYLGISLEHDSDSDQEKPPAQDIYLAYEAFGSRYERIIKGMALLMVAESAIFAVVALFKNRSKV